MLLEPQRLDKRVARHLQDSGHELWLSPVRVWEAILLADPAVYSMDLGPWTVEGMPGGPKMLPAREAAINRQVALVPISR